MIPGTVHTWQNYTQPKTHLGDTSLFNWSVLFKSAWTLPIIHDKSLNWRTGSLSWSEEKCTVWDFMGVWVLRITLGLSPGSWVTDSDHITCSESDEWGLNAGVHAYCKLCTQDDVRTPGMGQIVFILQRRKLRHAQRLKDVQVHSARV